MKKLDMNRYRPLGRENSQYLQMGWVVLLTALLMSLSFFGELSSELDDLYVTRAMGMFPGKRVLKAGAVMAQFSSISENCFILVPFFWIFMGLEVIDCYDYHKKDTKSIYLMRRLPDKWELHRRCWGKPVIHVGISLLAMAGLKTLYFLAYLVFTPWECLPY